MSHWLPLEANPEVMNKYIKGLGTPEKFSLVDVLGTDSELLAMIPQPVLAILLLFPCNENYETYCKEQVEALEKSGDTNCDKTYFVKQTIHNACGTIALIHAISNNTDVISLTEGSPLEKFLRETKDKSPAERGEELEKNEEISTRHSEHALLGQTEAPNPEEQVNLHFVALVNVGGELYELDGRKPFPVKYGPTNATTFVEDAAKVAKQYMERDPNELSFSLMALTGQ